jgi:hypothetical protein
MDQETEQGSGDIRSALESAFAKQKEAELPRDDTGRLATAEATTASDGAAPVSTNGSLSAPEAAPVSTPEPDLAPPASLKAEVKAQWSTLPAWAKQEFIRRESDFNRGIQEKGQEASFARAVRQTLAPHQDDYKTQGMNEQQAVEFLVGMHDFYKRDPVGYLKHVAQAAGIDLSALPQQQQAQQGQYNPQLTALERRLATMEQEKKASEQASLQSEIEKFSSEKPHFEDVRLLMAALLDSGQAQDLQAAYDMAVYASPTTRARILEDQRKTEAERQTSEARQKAAKAKSAAVSVKGAPGGAVSTKASPKTVRDALTEAFSQSGRA